MNTIEVIVISEKYEYDRNADNTHSIFPNNRWVFPLNDCLRKISFG